MNREVFEKQLCNKSSHHGKFSIAKRKPSHVTTESKLFAVKNMNGIQRRACTGKSMKNVFYILRYAKKHLSG